MVSQDEKAVVEQKKLLFRNTKKQLVDMYLDLSLSHTKVNKKLCEVQKQIYDKARDLHCLGDSITICE